MRDERGFAGGLCTFDLYGAALGDARGVWADAVPARRGRLDLEAHILVVRVLQPDELLRLRVELHWQTSRARVSSAHGRAAAAGGRVLCGAVAAWGRRGDPSPRPCPPPPADRRASPCGRDGHRPRSRWRRGRGLGPLGRPPRGAGRGLGVARVNRSTAGSILSCGTSSFPGPAMAPEPERLPLPQSRQDTGAINQTGLLARCSLG